MEELVAQGRNPPALDRKPEIPEYLEFYVESFWRIRRTKTKGETIELSDLVSHLQLYPWYDVDEFIELLLTMNSAFLEHSKQDGSTRRHNTKRNDRLDKGGGRR